MAQKRVALVTGAGTGIGKAAALALLKDGYHVALVGRRADMLEKTAAESGAKDRAMACPGDITKPEVVKSIFAKVKDKWGRLDVLFNNAGMGAPAVPMEDLPIENIRVPTLIIAGEEDTVYPPELARGMARRIPGAELATMKGAGHLANLEHPEEFNRILLDFLQRTTP